MTVPSGYVTGFEYAAGYEFPVPSLARRVLDTIVSSTGRCGTWSRERPT
jgi:hypothetical protein